LVAGVEYQLKTQTDMISQISMLTDQMFGLQYIATHISSIPAEFLPEIKILFKSLLSNFLTSTSDKPEKFTAQTTSIQEIYSYWESGDQNKEIVEYQVNNPLVKINLIEVVIVANEFPIINEPTTITSAQFKKACALAWTYYEPLLVRVFKTQNKFSDAMVNKADKSVLLDRRNRLINFLKQFELDVNLNLSFFGEMATLYNATTNPQLLQSTPQCFSTYTPNQRGEEAMPRGGSGQEYRQQPPQAEYQQQQQSQYQQPAQAQYQQQPQSQYQQPRNATSSFNEPSNNESNMGSRDSEVTEDSDKEEPFTLPTRPPPTSDFYTGSRQQYS